MFSRYIIIIIISYIPCFGQQNPLPLSLELYLQCSNPTNDSIKIPLVAQGKVWDEYNEISTETELYNSSILFNQNYFASSVGWDIVHSRTSGQQVFRYGLYKISTNHSDAQFYLNYLDCRTKGDYGIDLTIKYFAENQSFYYQIGTPNNSDFIYINNKQILNIWTLKNQGVPTTSCFENYWQNCLVSIPEEEHLSV